MSNVNPTLEDRVRKQLRVRDRLTTRELAERAGVRPKAITHVMHNLVADGSAVRHPGGTTRGSVRSPTYSKPSRGKLVA